MTRGPGHRIYSPGNKTGKIQVPLRVSFLSQFSDRTGREMQLSGLDQCAREKAFTKGKRKARVHHSQEARPPAAYQISAGISRGLRDKGGGEKGESSSTESRQVGNDTR